MDEALTVTEVNNYIKKLFSKDFILSRVTVKGEISNCKYHPAGNIFFTLKDEGAALNCVMFASGRANLGFRLKDGQQVEASGQISVYEKTGGYQLYVRNVELSGAGELYERFLKLKQEMLEMGMFDDMYKKPVPPYARRIGIVTAQSGAAIRDIINVSTRRNPYVELVLYPALVQGEGAAESIAKGIRKLDALGLDVMIVGRGGGSIEDLWAFNEEIVANAIFEAETPVISAVGHETDFTIADFVADLRAPTPSAAAELATFEYDAFTEELNVNRAALRRNLDYKLNVTKSGLRADRERLQALSPENVLEEKRRTLEKMEAGFRAALTLKARSASQALISSREALKNAAGRKYIKKEAELKVYSARLDSLSPLKKLSAGYGYVRNEGGAAVTSAAAVKAGETISVTMRDGVIDAKTLGVRPGRQYGAFSEDGDLSIG